MSRGTGTSRSRFARGVLVATGVMLYAVGLPAPANGDVTSVESSAFGVSITPPNTSFSVAEQPTVAFSNSGSGSGTNQVSQTEVDAPPVGNPPGGFFKALSLFVRTGQTGTLGTHTAGTASRADVEHAAYLSDVFIADQVHTECTATGDGSSGTTTFGSVSFNDGTGFKTYNNYAPAPNTTVTLFGNIGTVTFNEQTSLNGGQTTGIIVTAIHIRRGPIDIYVAQSKCTATGPDVVVPPPDGCDLSIVKAMAPDPLVIGQPATITLTVANVGRTTCGQFGTAAQTVVADVQPLGLTLNGPPAPSQSGVWVCGLSSGTATCNTPSDLAPGYSATFTINATVTATSGSSINNCATVAHPSDVNPLNNSSCVIREPADPPPLPICDLTVEKHMTPDPLLANADASIELTVTNLGTAPCQGATVQDDRVPGLTLSAPSDQPFNWFCGIVTSTGAALCSNFTTLAGGYTAKITLPAHVAGNATFVKNCATVGSTSDANPANNTGCAESNVIARPFCDLAVKKEMAPVPLVSGQPATITITVSNVGTGPCDAAATTLSDNRVAGLVFTSKPSGPEPWVCSLTAGNALCTGPGNIPIGGQFVFTMPALVTGAPGSVVTNCATATNANDTGTVSNRGCAEGTPVDPSLKCDLRVKKEMSPQPLKSGSAATIAVTVTNIGGGPCLSDSVDKITLEDPPPPGMTFTSAPVTGGWSCSLTSGTVRCTRSTEIPALAHYTFTFKAKVTAPVGDRVRNCASVTNVSGAGTIEGCKELPVFAGSPAGFCDLQVTKRMIPTALKANKPVTIVLTVTNVGKGPCAGTATDPTRLTDGPVTGMVFLPPAARQSGWFCGLDDAVTAECFNPTPILKGQTVSIVMRATVTAAAGSTITNCVTVSNPNDIDTLSNTKCLGPLLVT